MPSTIRFLMKCFSRLVPNLSLDTEATLARFGGNLIVLHACDLGGRGAILQVLDELAEHLVGALNFSLDLAGSALEMNGAEFDIYGAIRRVGDKSSDANAVGLLLRK